MQTQGHMNYKKTWKLPTERQALCATFSGICTQRRNIRAKGAQSCVTTVPECSYVMDW